MQTVKTVGKSGQISLGRALAGADFIMEELPGGDIILKRALVIPVNERWQHDPEFQKKIIAAKEWMKNNKPVESNLDELVKSLGIES